MKSVLFVLAIAFVVAGLRFFLPALILPTVSYEASPEVGDEVVVKFSPFVSESQARVSFRIEPNVPGTVTWLQEYRELHFVPIDGFRPDVTYRVSTVPRIPLFAAVIAPQIFAFVPGAPVPVKTAVVEAPVQTGKFIDINLSTMMLTLIENGQVKETLPVAGKGNPWLKPTREGSFRILSKETRHFSSIYKVWQPYTMRYSGNYSIHGWPYWPNGARLTSRYSGGCIRLADDVAQKVFAWVDIGTPINIHSTPGRVTVFSSDSIVDGDLVREVADPKVYVVKIVGTERFKRHVLSEKFAEWYPHLKPFQAKIKTVPDATLASYITSRWVRSADPSDVQGNHYVYEISPDAKKHMMLCGQSPGSVPVGPEYCESAWVAYDWDPEELFTVAAQELESYSTGAPIILPQAR